VDAADAVVLRWNSATGRFAACGCEGQRQLWQADFDSSIAEHPALMAALQRGEDVFFGGRILLPIACAGKLEGVLALAAARPVDGSARRALRGMCESAALLLASLRERDRAMETMAAIASEITNPLTAARGFTRMALDDARTSCAGRPEYLSAALRNINRLGEIAVGLQHAGIDA
jgi:signal transduction histidine kinase